MDSLLAWLPLLAEKNIADALLIAAILVATITMLMRLYRYQARQKRGGSARLPERQAEPDPRGLHAGAPDSIVRWEVEMHELSRDLKAEIESKMIALGHLIRDADRAANRLEKAIAATDDPDIAAATKLPGMMSSAELDGAENASLREEIYTLADYGFPLPDIAGKCATLDGRVELILRLREQPK